MPQSNGACRPRRGAARDAARAFGAPPAITLRRLSGEGDTWIAEAQSDYGGDVYQTVVIFEFRDGLDRA